MSSSNQYGDPKEGSKCCGCCCDMRRAVIIVNIVQLVLGIIGTVVYATAPDFLDENFDDDAAIEVLEDSYKDLAIISGIGIAFALIGGAGGVLYNIWMVGLGILFLLASYIASTIITFQSVSDVEDVQTGDEDVRSPIASVVIGAVITGLFIYPHVGFILEVKNGTMSKATYAREVYSCCCVE